MDDQIELICHFNECLMSNAEERRSVGEPVLSSTQYLPEYCTMFEVSESDRLSLLSFLKEDPTPNASNNK